MRGSFLQNETMPRTGQEVYALAGFEAKVVSGKVKKLHNIDNRGLANIYIDITVGGANLHTDISQVFDHEPKQVKTEDDLGPLTIWE